MPLTPVPTGNDVQVNTSIGTQSNPTVTALADGGFIVVWDHLDGDGVWSIRVQRYAADGSPVGGEFQANTTVAGQTYEARATALGDGGFVIAWSSNNQDGSGFGIYAQRYAADGTALGTEFRVNTFTTGDQVEPAVTALAGGGFVVTWSSNGQDGSGYGVYGQRYAADGTPLGTEFRLNQITAGQQFADTFYGNTTVATLANGQLVQVWSGQGTEEVFFRLINVPNSVLDDTATTNEDTAVNVPVLANDTFGGTPQITGTTNGAHGSVSLNDNGTSANFADDFVVYTPAADFNGTDSFTYTVTSGGVTDTATVSVTVTAVADIANDTAITGEDAAVNVLVQGNDNFDDPTHRIFAATNGAHGSVSIN